MPRRSPTAPALVPVATATEAATATAAATPAASADASRADRDGAPALSLGVMADVLGYHLAQATVTTTDTFTRHVGKPFDLRKVEYSLLALVQANGPLSPKRLGHALALSAPHLTQLLDRMQHRGLIRRERSATDGRSHSIVLTPTGEHIATDSLAAAKAMEAELNHRLSPAERLMLIELLRKVAGR
jgi:DNA-binding MarR family transcriptional regulator